MKKIVDQPRVIAQAVAGTKTSPFLWYAAIVLLYLLVG